MAGSSGGSAAGLIGSSSVTQLAGQESEGVGSVVGKRGRGRPKGAKNKDKNIIAGGLPDSTNSLRAHILEVDEGRDIFNYLNTLAYHLQRAICVVCGKGTVTGVILLHPSSSSSSSSADPVVTNYGHQHFTILSISGLILPPPAPLRAQGLALFLAGGGEGQFVGGDAVGPLMAVGPVTVTAISFPLDEETVPLLHSVEDPSSVLDSTSFNTKLLLQELGDGGTIVEDPSPGLASSSFPVGEDDLDMMMAATGPIPVGGDDFAELLAEIAKELLKNN